MSRQKGARKIEDAPQTDRTEEPRAPQAYSTGEYRFFRTGETPVPAGTTTGVHLPLSSGGWLVPLLAVAVIAALTFLLLK